MADIGKFEHSSGFGVGENLFWSAGPSVGSDDQAVAAVQAWYDEIENYNFNTGQTNGGVIGHFTQVVWDDTSELGIGMVSTTHPDYGRQVYVVGQYVSRKSCLPAVVL